MKTKITLLFLTCILFACSRNFPAPQTSPAQNPTLTPFQIQDINPTTEIPLDLPTNESPNPKFIATLSTPHIDPGPNGDFPTPSTSQQDCGFTWAYHDLPEVTASLDAAVKTFNPNASSHATAFGEDCVGNDGQFVRFAAMETDFYVTLFVSDLKDYASFGNWITQVMQIVNSFPPDMLAGTRSGFVEFRFEKSESESIGLRVPIQGYNETANGIIGEELFRMYYVE
jgi:hypothetical protein